jgi:hypothetical protein
MNAKHEVNDPQSQISPPHFSLRRPPARITQLSSPHGTADQLNHSFDVETPYTSQPGEPEVFPDFSPPHFFDGNDFDILAAGAPSPIPSLEPGPQEEEEEEEENNNPQPIVENHPYINGKLHSF